MILPSVTSTVCPSGRTLIVSRTFSTLDAPVFHWNVRVPLAEPLIQLSVPAAVSLQEPETKFGWLMLAQGPATPAWVTTTYLGVFLSPGW